MKKYILLFLLLGGAVALASAQNAIKGKIKGYIGEKITVSYYKGKQRQTDTVISPMKVQNVWRMP